MDNVDEYIDQFPSEVQKRLQQIRKTIIKIVPGVEEYIGYQMPAYKWHGPLVYFAAWKNHIGLYPAGKVEPFSKDLKDFKFAKGSIQFPHDQPLPMDLIKRIISYRVLDNEKKAGVAFLELLPSPAKRALEGSGINNLKKLAKYSEQQLLELHGFGKSSLPVIKEALAEAGLSLKK